MTSDYLDRVLRATVQEPIASIFVNRSIDWQDDEIDETRSMIDLSILVVSFSLNFIVFIAATTKRRMRNPFGCYVVSMTISNFVILLNVLDDVLDYWLGIKFEPDLDFVGRVSLQSSSLTLVVFTIDRYIAFCRVDSVWHKNISELTTAVKGILIIWCYAAIASALELNLYEHFRTRTIVNIFCFSTGMYVLFPILVIIGLDLLILLELVEYRQVAAAKWTTRDLKNLRFLVCLTVGFFVTMAPQRVATILYYKEPQICCSPLTMNICYYLAKVSTIIVPIICIVTFKNLNRSLLEIMVCPT